MVIVCVIVLLLAMGVGIVTFGVYLAKPSLFSFGQAPTTAGVYTEEPTDTPNPSTVSPLLSPTTPALTVTPLSIPTTPVTPATTQAPAVTTAPLTPGICNTRACQAVITSYLNNNWAYTSSDFGECLNCPTVKYPNNLAPTLSNQKLQWSNNTSGFTRFLDCDGASCSLPNNKVQIWDGSPASGQLFTWRNNGLYSGTEHLATLNNGVADGTPVVGTTIGDGGTGGQQWVWQVPATGNGWQLKNPLSGKCLDIAGGVDSNGTIAQLWNCDTSSARWKPV